jgi:hypothetical protein
MFRENLLLTFWYQLIIIFFFTSSTEGTGMWLGGMKKKEINSKHRASSEGSL